MHSQFSLGRMAVLAIICGALAGCAARNNLNSVGTAATQPPGAPAAAGPSAASSPYVLSAQCNGPMVQFSLQNLSDQELQVQNKDFALLVPGKDRKVIPYSKEEVTIDLPTDTIAPRQTIQGRAVFSNNAAPNGCRLVFKPYSRPADPGTFAAISGGPSS